MDLGEMEMLGKMGVLVAGDPEAAAPSAAQAALVEAALVPAVVVRRRVQLAIEGRTTRQ